MVKQHALITTLHCIVYSLLGIKCHTSPVCTNCFPKAASMQKKGMHTCYARVKQSKLPFGIRYGTRQMLCHSRTAVCCVTTHLRRDNVQIKRATLRLTLRTRLLNRQNPKFANEPQRTQLTVCILHCKKDGNQNPSPANPKCKRNNPLNTTSKKPTLKSNWVKRSSFLSFFRCVFLKSPWNASFTERCALPAAHVARAVRVHHNHTVRHPWLSFIMQQILICQRKQAATPPYHTYHNYRRADGYLVWICLIEQFVFILFWVFIVFLHRVLLTWFRFYCTIYLCCASCTEDRFMEPDPTIINNSLLNCTEIDCWRDRTGSILWRERTLRPFATNTLNTKNARCLRYAQGLVWALHVKKRIN